MADLQETIDLRRRARRRLIGAIALVLALVIVPPWIMDLEPKPAQTRLSVEIPATDASRLKPPAKPQVPEVAPQKPQEPGKAADTPKAGAAAKPADTARSTETAKPSESSKPAPSKPAAAPAPQSLDARTVAALGAPKTGAEPDASGADKPKPAEPAPKPETAKRSAETATADAARKAPEAAPAPAPGTEGFVVPLGSYGNAENVKQLQARLANEGIQSYTEAVKTAAGERTRVRAGPYPSREAAEKVRERVKGMGIDAGNVIARQ